MALTTTPNPQPVSISSQPISIKSDSVTVSDTSRYTNDNISISSDINIVLNVAVNSIIEVSNITFACADNDVFKIILKGSGGTQIFVGYCIGNLFLTTNVRYTCVAEHFTVNVSRLSGTGTGIRALSLVYKITAP